jgi:hypothetical protein
MVEAAAAAAEHLWRHGLPPILDIGTVRALWRTEHRELAGRLNAYGLAR